MPVARARQVAFEEVGGEGSLKGEAGLFGRLLARAVDASGSFFRRRMCHFNNG
jgi:hypothetical protein